MQVFEYLTQVYTRLCEAGFDSSEARSLARILLGHLQGCEPSCLLLHRREEVDPQRGEALLSRLLAGEPLQYLLGESPFLGLDFLVGPEVLIPRFDSECLAERAIQLLQGKEKPLLADVCCGSGCLGLSIAHHLPGSRAVLTDISPAALAMAERNAERLGLQARCRFFPGDLAQPLLEAGCCPELLIANPPYIPSEEIGRLSPQVQREPHLALDGGGDGLQLYPRLIGQCRQLLPAGGWLILEHGDEQQDAICQLLESGGFRVEERLFDLGGRPRGVLARQPD